MINLLPPEYRLRLRYGRLNARLSYWIVLTVALTAGLLLLLGAGWLYMDQQARSLKSSISANQNQLQVQNLEEVRKQADEISQNVRIINQVLRSELRFSDLIQEMGKVMPPGTALNSLSLSSKISGSIDLSAKAKDYTSGAQIAVNLSDPKSNIFDKVDIVNINCAAGDGDYPCIVSLKALFNSRASQRFLNAGNDSNQ